MKNAHRISWHTPINSVSSCFFAGVSGRTDGCRTILSSTELQYYIARQYTKHMPKRKAGPGTGFYDPNRLAQREQFAISNSVSGIPFRHNRTFACFCARLFVPLDTPARQICLCPRLFALWLRRRYSASEKMQASLLFSLGLFVSLSSKKNYEPEKWHWKSSKPCSAASA